MNTKEWSSLTFSQDKLWLEAKRVAKTSGFKDKWIEIIDYYNMNDGKYTQIMCVIEGKRYRILYILDDNSILLLDRDGQLLAKDYEDVDTSRKIFYYQPEPDKVVKELSDGMYISSQTEVIYYA